MLPTLYLDVVGKINDELENECEDLVKQGVFLEYSSTYYVDCIFFIGIAIYNSENDEDFNTKFQLEEFLRRKISDIIKGLLKWQNSSDVKERIKFMGFKL